MPNSREAVPDTWDKDFSELVLRRNLVEKGVLLIRLSGVSISTRKRVFLRAGREHGGEFDGALFRAYSDQMEVAEPL